MARSMRKGYETNPMRVGAPLPDSLTGVPVPPSLTEIGLEMDRAEVELMYAIARHRQAWNQMRKRAREREALVDMPGMVASFESDPIWKKRTSDVTWWRDEMTAQATAYTALERMHAVRVRLAAEARGEK